MPNRKLFSPIYPNLRGTPDETRVNPMVSVADCRTIISCAGDSHILNHICQLAIKSAAAYVRTNNLTILDSDKFADYLRQRSVGDSHATPTVASDDSGRVESGGKHIKDAKNGKPESGKGVTRGRK